MLTLSYSSLRYFYESGCPAAWEYSLSYAPLKNDPFAERGILVHRILEGTVPLDEVTDRFAVKLYEKIVTLRDTLGLKILASEQLIKNRPVQGVKWKARVDAFAETPTGRQILIDYKTMAGGIKTVPRASGVPLVPHFLTFQGVGSLMPGYGTPWPKEMWFLVASFRGPAQTIVYHYDKKDYDNLLKAIRLVKSVYRLRPLPYRRGSHCLKCRYCSLCYKSPGWQKEYKKWR